MKCKTLHSRLIFFLEGDLPEHEMEEVKSHLEKCTGCAEFAAELKKMLLLLSTDKVNEVNPFLYTRIKARLDNEKYPERKTVLTPSIFRIFQPVAFSLLLIAGIYTGFKISQPITSEIPASSQSTREMIPYLNEMEFESIETFLME